MEEEDDDIPTLSERASAALQEFYAELQKQQENLERLESNIDNADNIMNEITLLEENWQLSQFWYNEATVQALVKVVDKSLADNGKAALISCPTLFVPLKTQLGDRANVTLFEYDRRFEVLGTDFIFYDYNLPDKLPADLEHSFDLVIADPPFLSEECITKTSQTIKSLSKDKIVVCTGAVMRSQVEKLLSLKQCNFKPEHKNNLANEFSCYANFDLDDVLK